MTPSLHILLVEDNPGYAELVQEILADSQDTIYTFTLANRLEIAIRVLATTRVDLILLDLGLPDSVGMETVKKMLAAAESLPIIILTDTDDRQLGFEAIKAGAQDYLVKGMIAQNVFERIIRYSMERHRNRQQVKESEQFLRATLDALAAHIAILDHTGRILNVNKAWSDFARQNNANFETTGVGVNYFAICNTVTGEDAVTAFAAADGIRAVIDGTRQAFQLEYPCHSPTEQRWFHLQATPFPGTAQRHVVLTHEDITVSKQAKEALQERVKELNCLQAISRAIQSNASLENILQESVDCLPEGFQYPEIACARILFEGQQFQTGRFRETDWRLAADLRFHDNTVGAVEVCYMEERPDHDEGPFLKEERQLLELIAERLGKISESKEAEEALRIERNNISAIFDSSPVAMMVLDESIHILNANQAAIDLCGGDETLVIHHRPGDALHCAHSYEVGCGYGPNCPLCPVRRGIESLIAGTGGHIHNAEVKLSIMPGNKEQKVWLSISAKDMLFAGKRAVCVTLIDITKSKQAEEKREEIQAQVSQAQKMESLGALAGGIAHDFNNILSGVLGYAELAKGQAKDPTLIEYLDQIYAAGARATDLVRQILTFSRRRNTELQPLQVPLVIKEALKLLRSTLPASIAIKTLITKEVDPVLADPTQIHQIVMNLCTNASHAMEPDGGTLTVTIDQVTPEPLFFEQHPGLMTGSYLRLRIGDTGCGMSPDILSSIFDPYFTTKELGEGTGLGLAVVHGIVKDYGGGILVDSVPEQGSLFTVLLPVTSKVIFDLETVQDNQLLTGTERILLVDDELAITGLYKKFLEFHGYRVTTFNDPLKALETFRGDPMAFDLILSDVAMPGMTGEKMGLQMLALRPDLPIVLMTGFSQHLTEAIAKKQGFQTLMIKPLPKNLLLVKLREIFINSKKH